MISSGWQNVLAVAIVLAAALYLARRMWRMFARQGAGGCGSGACGDCPSNKEPEQLVKIELPRGSGQT